MSPSRPYTLSESSAQRHPALSAWNQCRSARGALDTLEVWREKPTLEAASVYRLLFRDPVQPAVFVKHCDATSGAVERLCYEEILPELRLPSPAFYGSHEDADGSWWLFLEDVGRERFSAHDPVHRGLASHWIARLHRRGTATASAARLPDAGPKRYLAYLHSARDRIRRNTGNPGLTQDDRDVLRNVLAAQDRIEERWDALERVCLGLPRTIVHGDFRPKNVRVRPGTLGPTLYALDWELAGWGPPVADLAPARGSDTMPQIDFDVYAAEMSHPGLDAAAAARFSTVGYLFRRLAAIDWDSLHLHYEDPEFLVGPMASLQAVHRAVDRSLSRAQEWLA